MVKPSRGTLTNEQERAMSDDNVDEDEDIEDEQYEIGPADRAVVKAAIQLLEKILHAPLATPAKGVSVSKILHVLKRLPNPGSEMTVSVSLTGPRRLFHSQGEEHEVYHWWDVEIEGRMISICSAGHFYRKSTGGDTFISMRWTAAPGYQTDHGDYLHQLSIVADAQPFDLEVAHIDLSNPGYSLEVRDDDNTLLEEISDDEVDIASSDDEEDEEDDEPVQDKTTPELTVNLWAFLDSTTGLIYALAGRAYYLSGDDDQKLTTLRELSRHDFRCADRFPVPERFTLQFGDGTTRSGLTTPQAVRDPESQLFEEVFGELESALPPIPDFRSGKAKEQCFSDDPFCVRTIVYEDEAGNGRAIVTDEDRQWLADQIGD
jgi:hypothetical protein